MSRARSMMMLTVRIHTRSPSSPRKKKDAEKATSFGTAENAEQGDKERNGKRGGEQMTPPADLSAEEDDREDDDGHDDVENGPAEARRQACKLDYPEGGRDAEAQSNDCRRSEDADEQTPSSV
jgi:hypothetical protein